MDSLAERLTRTFCELVRIDSLTFAESEIADAVEGHLEAFGLTTWRDDADARTVSDTGNLFGRLAGARGMPSIAFLAHMDTVEPGRGIQPVVEDGVIKSSGDTVLGADDKSAIAIILEALRTIGEEGHPHGDVVVAFTIAEEKGLIGAKAMDPAVQLADRCFVLDADGPVGSAVVRAPWQNTIKARVHGKAAHAGANPSQGINAIAAASRAIAAMTLGQIDGETTANIGRIEGGRATNIVPDLCEVAGEARSHDRGKLEGQTAAMVAAFEAAEAEGCTVEVDVIDEYHGYAFTGDEPIVKLFERACARIGVAPTRKVSGGGSDANVLNDRGMPALALSCGMQAVHTTAEHVRVDQLVAGHDLVLALVAEAMAD